LNAIAQTLRAIQSQRKPKTRLSLPQVPEQFPQTQKSTASESGAYEFCARHWPPSYKAAGGYSTVPVSRFSRPVRPFEGRSLAFSLAEDLPFLVAAWNFFRSRYITGTLYIAIDAPNFVLFIINNLEEFDHFRFPHYGSY